MTKCAYANEESIDIKVFVFQNHANIETSHGQYMVVKDLYNGLMQLQIAAMMKPSCHFLELLTSKARNACFFVQSSSIL